MEELDFASLTTVDSRIVEKVRTLLREGKRPVRIPIERTHLLLHNHGIGDASRINLLVNSDRCYLESGSQFGQLRLLIPPTGIESAVEFKGLAFYETRPSSDQIRSIIVPYELLQEYAGVPSAKLAETEYLKLR